MGHYLDDGNSTRLIGLESDDSTKIGVETAVEFGVDPGVVLGIKMGVVTIGVDGEVFAPGVMGAKKARDCPLMAVLTGVLE